MIALLAGHCLRGTGRHVRALPGAEFDYIRVCCQAVQSRWDARGFRQGRIVMTPDSVGATAKDASNQSILDRIAICKSLRVAAAVELHFNTDRNGRRDDYSLTFYQKGCQIGRDLSAHLKARLFPVLGKYGSNHWHEVGLPDRKWPHRRGAVQDAPYPAVLLEPLFMSNPDHQPFFINSDGLQSFSLQLADSLQAFMEVHNVRGQPTEQRHDDDSRGASDDGTTYREPEE